MKYSFSTLVRWVGMGATPVVIVIVTILSLSPPTDALEMVTLIPFGDKGAHALAYMVLGFSMTCAVITSAKPAKFSRILQHNRGQVVTIMVLIFLIGAIIELVQPYFLRSCELGDLIADCIGGGIGVFLGLSIIMIVQKYEQKRGKS